jgi:hypothetical protein
MCRIHDVMAELLNRMKKSLFVVSDTKSMPVGLLFWIGIGCGGGNAVCFVAVVAVVVLLLLLLWMSEATLSSL